MADIEVDGGEQAAIARLSAIRERQRRAFDAELPVGEGVRRDRLKRAAALLADNAEAWARAMSDDFGHRSREQSLIADVAATLGQARFALKHLARWMRAERRSPEFPLGLLGASARVEFQPKGVVGVIAPWNFPVNLTMGPVIGALAAGNRAMAKLSEYTPETARLFTELAPRYFDETEVAFATGGPAIGQAFARLPFDHLLFTGATGIGRHILHAAADNLTPVTLELGGKSPVIVGASADVARTAERIAMGKTMNAGQICLAPDYLLVSPEREQAVVKGVRDAVAAMYPTMLGNDDYTAVINARHRDRLQGLIDDARAKGAEVVEVNPAGEDFARQNGTKMPLSILTNVTDDMAVMQEEIFGPVLPVMRVADVDAAIAYVNAHDRPLGLYYFGNDRAEEARVLDRTVSGGVTVNDVVFHVGMEDLPFGGVGPSGTGAYHGRDGFRTFSHAKAVYRQPRLDVAKLGGLKPPYGAATTKAIARAMKGFAPTGATR